MDACPIDNTKRSRFGHTGSCGSNRRNRCQRQDAVGARAMGVPGCPELAACTPSMERVRMVLMLICSIVWPVIRLGDTVAMLIESWKSFRAGLVRIGKDRGSAEAVDGSCDPLTASTPSLEHY